jgi:hypothetical protein
MFNRIATIAIMLIVLVPAVSLASSKSGLKGLVTIDDPTCRAQPSAAYQQASCRIPYQATVDVMDKDGVTKLSEFESNQQGRFQITLEPGEYLLVPHNGFRYPRAEPQPAVVKSAGFTKVNINYDSGAR